MSLISLLTATEKQDPSGLLHMRPIQWHLKANWYVPDSSRNQISIPNSLHKHPGWWLQGENALVDHHLHIFHTQKSYASNVGWGVHLGDFTASGLLTIPESKLHINVFELKAVLLALKPFECLCRNKSVLIAADNTMVVAYTNKEEGGIK